MIIAPGLSLFAATLAAASPCQRIAPEAFAARLRAERIMPSRHFRFGGAHFYRASGHVDCQLVRDGGSRFAACSFSGPVALQIATSNGRYDFWPESGPATVTVRGAQVSCVRPG